MVRCLSFVQLSGLEGNRLNDGQSGWVLDLVFLHHASKLLAHLR